MTEAEWLAGGDRAPMFELLRPVASDRKCRLFCVACCRECWDQFTDDLSRHAVNVAERYADGLASDSELGVAEGNARRVATVLNQWCLFAGAAAETASHRVAPPEHGWVGGSTTDWYMHSKYWEAVSEFIAWFPNPSPFYAEPLERHHCDLLRDIFGNPFRPVDFSPEWRTDTVVSLARGMYDSRDFTAMPILADALQDAGCENEVILEHCRGTAPHVRGCWVADLLLERG
jgi:hypothetical protein